LQRREFLELLSLAALAGAALRPRASEAQAAGELYDVKPFGNVSLLHITDTHAQLLPVYFREPAGKAFLDKYRIQSGTPLAHALTNADFEALARRYGKVGGFAHLATLAGRARPRRCGRAAPT
jgi:sulfur-oxidizing protein SoxB